MNIIWISLGAVLGALLRYLLQEFFEKFSTIPWGTLSANLIGCFLIGCVYAISDQIPHGIKLGVMTGFLGALTTMSTFSLDIFLLIQQKKWFLTMGIAGATAIGGVMLCAVGFFLGEKLKSSF